MCRIEFLHDTICMISVLNPQYYWAVIASVLISSLLYFGTVPSFSFSFTSRWHSSARKGPYAIRPVSQQSPQGCPRNRSFPNSEGGASVASFLHCRPLPFSIVGRFLSAVSLLHCWPLSVGRFLSPLLAAFCRPLPFCTVGRFPSARPPRWPSG